MLTALTAASILIGSLAAFHVFSAVWSAIGIQRAARFQKRAANEPLPSVSVLVAAKDEEQNLEACLESLLNQNYPADRYEVAVVDDRSADRTPQIIAAFQTRYPNLKSLRIEQDPVGLTGKQNALRQGIQMCEGEVILNTDADCAAPPGWAASMAQRFTEEVGLVIGVTLTHARDAKAPLLAKVQSLDLAALMGMAVGSAGWNAPISCIGNNFAYRKAAFDEVGGYEAMGPALTEDGQLLRMIHRSGRWKISAAIDPESAMITEPETAWRDFYRQRLRWILGGFEMNSIPLHMMRVMMAYYWYLIFSPAVLLIWPELWIATAAGAGSKLAADFILALQSARHLGRRDILTPFLPFSLYYVLYGGLIGLATIFSKKVVWKGQTYRRRS